MFGSFCALFISHFAAGECCSLFFLLLNLSSVAAATLVGCFQIMKLLMLLQLKERFFKVENGHHFPLELHVVVEARKSAQTVPELKICARHVRLHVISPLRRFFLPISICRQNFCCCCFKTDDDDGLCLRPWCLVAKDANSVNLFCFSLSSDDSVCVVCRLYLTLARPCC